MNTTLNILLDYHICSLESNLLRVACVLLLGLHHPLSVLGEGRVAEAQPAPVEAVPGPPNQKTSYVYCTVYLCTVTRKPIMCTIHVYCRPHLGVSSRLRL